MSPDPVRVVVVEDSTFQRAHVVRALEADGTLVVVGEARNAADAIRVVREERPDVVTMDLELPDGRPDRAGGLLAIDAIMAEAAVPILVLSSHAASTTDLPAIDALAAGAVDVLPKPPSWTPEAAAALRRRVLVLARLPMVNRAGRPPVPTGARAAAPGPAVLALAASTGGPSALRTVLLGLGAVGHPVLVVQHIHADFSTSFAGWLAGATRLPVRLAVDGEEAEPGCVHVAPAHHHLRLAARGRLALDPEPEGILRPSCDELLLSVAEYAGPRGVGAVLTGMGDDGTRGLLALRRAGGTTFAQDAESSVVDGMPRAAREAGAAQQVLGVLDLGPALADALRRVAAT